MKKRGSIKDLILTQRERADIARIVETAQTDINLIIHEALRREITVTLKAELTLNERIKSSLPKRT